MGWNVSEFQPLIPNIEDLQSSSQIIQVQDLQVPHSSEVIIEPPSDPPDPIPVINEIAYPEHDYSTSSNTTISSLSKKLSESESKNAELASKCAMLEAKLSKMEKENSDLKSTRSRLRLFNTSLTKQNQTLKKTNKEYRYVHDSFVHYMMFYCSTQVTLVTLFT